METSSSHTQRGGDPERPASEEMRRLLGRAVAASSNGIVITDPKVPDNPIVYVNPAFEEISGYTAEEVRGRNCRFLQGDYREQPALDELREALTEGRECRVVLRNYRKDGTPFWNELYVSPVHDEDGRLTNFVGVQNDVTERRRIEEERDLLLVKEQLALAEAVEVRRRLALLAAAGPSLSASLDYEETLEGITRLLVPELADWCLLDMVDDNGSVNQLAAAHAEEEKEDLLRRLREHRQFGEGDPGSTSEVLRTGQSVLVPDLPDPTSYERALGRGEHLDIVLRLEPRSLMCVPLLARGRTMGAITLVLSSRSERRYDREDLLLAENLAYRCALAADNARLYRDRSEIARVLQKSLLPPHLPEIPGVEVGAEYLSVGEASEVGGDFYDLINTVEDGWICAIGDVRGKGVEAASVTALARYTIRAVTLKNDGPSEVLAALNEAMLRQLPEDRFCTVACVRLEPRDGAAGVGIDVSRAGHPPPLLVRPEGTVEEVGCSGRVLGVFPEAELRDTSLRLMPGEALVLYTDGVTEARSPDGDFFGEGRLRDLLSSCAGCDAVTFARRVKDAVLDFQEGYPHDDLAVLVLRASDGAAPAERGKHA
ncbi:MAG TPA: SpoIIE family protein phosphatase [Rubrobacter sp.]|nr:SpoIIE family protein phosphatase [Rubrobacter sp.]